MTPEQIETLESYVKWGNEVSHGHEIQAIKAMLLEHSTLLREQVELREWIMFRCRVADDRTRIEIGAEGLLARIPDRSGEVG